LDDDGLDPVSESSGFKNKRHVAFENDQAQNAEQFDEESGNFSDASGNPRLGRREHEVTKSDISHISIAPGGGINASFVRNMDVSQGPAPTTPIPKKKWDERSDLTRR
jgi:hypothetical protein